MVNVIKEIIDNVPDYDVFKTVDELNESSKKLAEKYPDAVEFYEIGKSTLGDPIYCLKIGSGKKKALMYAFPHPNEPIGSMMLDYLSEKLAESEELRELLDFTWYIVKVADNDGAKLNEGWFKGPFTPLNYSLNFYRPSASQQVEWTFPINYKTLNFNSPISETRALMNIIEEAKPDFIYSLHNAGFGGIYNYISEDVPLLYPIYEKAYKDLELPASLGEPEMPYAVKFADAVYKMPTTQDTFDYYEKFSDKDPAVFLGDSGTSSYDYATRFNERTFELVCEVPYYYDPKVEDLSEIDKSRRELVLKNLEASENNYKELKKIYLPLKDKIEVHTPMQDALDFFIEKISEESFTVQRNWAETSPELERNGTIAEAFDNGPVAKSYGMLVWGLLRRVFLANYEVTKNEELKAAADKIYDKMVSMSDDISKELDYKVIPVQKLVKVQLMTGLYTALYLKDRK